MRKYLLFICTALAASNTYAQRWHIKPTPEEIAYRQSLPKQTSSFKTTANYVMPSGANIPGEFEESQAVAIAWVYNGVAPDVSTSYGQLWCDMADAIQKECPVWIRIENGADSTAIKNYMASRGKPLTNYKFFVMIADDFWARDFGPLGFYYGANDDIGFMDMQYYPGRDNDDKFPELLANATGYTNVKSSLYAEGGNFVTDGFKKTFHSDVIENVNAAGIATTPAHNSWIFSQTRDSIKYAWTSDNDISLPSLQCDGGTGHIDMFMKLMDENTFAIMEYPTIVTAPDKNIINGIITTLSGTKNAYNRPYRIFKLPMPTQDDGSTFTTCPDIDGDARTFVNGLTVNKTYLMPSFSNSTSGNQAQDLAAINTFKSNAPGYKIVPLDSRILTVLGGAIHCVTMQIPAENPIHIWHPPVIDWQDKRSSFHLVSKITNKSGIASAVCKWRMKGTTTWNSVSLSDSGAYKIGDITGTFNYGDAVEYYISATSNNGKTITKPITAPEGYYTFMINWKTGINVLDPNKNFLLNPLPNPSEGHFYIPASLETEMSVTAIITDVLGKKINTLNLGKKQSGMNKLEFDLTNSPQGMYFIQIFANEKSLGTKRIMIQ